MSGRRFARTSLVAGLCNGEVLALMPFSGTMNAKLFNSWFGNMLCPELQHGSIVIMDNARFHSKKALKQIAESYGIVLLFLPPYSPDKNPIEQLWANIKRFLRYHMHKFSDLLSGVYGYLISN